MYIHLTGYNNTHTHTHTIREQGFCIYSFNFTKEHAGHTHREQSEHSRDRDIIRCTLARAREMCLAE